MARQTTGISYLIFIVTILGGFVFTVFVTVPAWSQLESERQRLQTTLQERDERQVFLTHIDARAEELKTLEKEARLLEVMFPDAVQSANLAGLLHSLSVRDGLTVERVGEARPPAPTRREIPPVPVDGGSVREGPTGGPPTGTTRADAFEKPYDATVTVRGTYAQIRAFLLDLEHTLQFFDILTVDLAREDTESGEFVLGHITLRLFTVAGLRDLVTPASTTADAG